MNTISSTCTTITYVLRLEDDCWYIGKSQSLHKRLTQHFNGKGAAWTKLHQPLELVRVYEDDREKEMTEYAINKYGKSNVRGYAWTRTNIN